VNAEREHPDVTVRAATMQDADLLLGWANDPVTRAQSFQPDRIEAATHERWLVERLVSPSSRLLIGLEGATPIGQVRFDGHPDGAVEVGISIAGHARNRGLGRSLLSAGLAAARLDGSIGVRTFVARVRLDNDVSAALFRGAGFSLVEESVCKGIPCLVFELPA
jgi:RimJ/RimL family protein N-acetyltransferase